MDETRVQEVWTDKRLPDAVFLEDVSQFQLQRFVQARHAELGGAVVGEADGPRYAGSGTRGHNVSAVRVQHRRQEGA